MNQRNRHEHPHPAGELQFQVLLLLPSARLTGSPAGAGGFLVDQLQSAEAADPLREVHDQIPVGQVEEVVDRPRLRPPPFGGATHFGAAEQFVVRQDQQAGVDQPEAAGEAADGEGDADVFRRRGGGCRGEDGGRNRVILRQHFREPPLFTDVVAGDQRPLADAQHRPQFVEHLGLGAGEAFDAFDPQVGGGLETVRGQRGDRHAGPLDRPLEDRFHREQPRGSSSRLR